MNNNEQLAPYSEIENEEFGQRQGPRLIVSKIDLEPFKPRPLSELSIEQLDRLIETFERNLDNVCFSRKKLEAKINECREILGMKKLETVEFETKEVPF